MSGVLFPDFLGTLSKAASFESNRAQTDYLNEDRAAKAEIAPLIPKALQGDKEALNQIGARHPDTFTKLMPMLQSMETNQRAKLKETSDWTTRAAMGVLSLPENERPAAYQAALADGQRLGYKIDMPPQYDRAVEGRLKHILNQARPIADYWKNQGENVQAMPPLDGGGMAPPAAGPGGSVIDRSRAASASLESGGRYDAVGPVVNAKGNRAYGAHQVMDFNIGPWTQEVLGKAMTPQQFLADQKAQDAVYNAKMGQYIQKYGSPEAAARAWFAGEGGMNNRNATDVLGTSVQGYGQRFAQAYGDGAFGAGPQPTMGTAPPSMVASGSNAAPMPQPPGGMAVPGTPAPMPQPPGLAQGDAAPRADASGNPLPPQQQNAREILTIRQFVHSQIPGASPLTVNGFPAYDKNGRLGIQLPNGQRDFIDVPKPKEPGADKGLFGDSLTGRALTVLRTADPTSQEYSMAYALMSKPQVIPDGEGGQKVVQPMDLSMFPRPAFGGGGQPAPAGPTLVGGQATTQIPGGGSMTSIPGKGKPLDNSLRDDLKKVGDTALELPVLLKSFDPSFGGYMIEALGTADNLRKRNLPDSLGGKDEKGQAQWWQRYDSFANLERNKLFGAALTAGETAAFKAAMVNSAMKPEQIQINLARQAEIAQKALSRVAHSAAASGYNRDAIEALVGTPFSAMPSPMGAAPQAPPAGPPAPAPQQQPAPQSAAEKGRDEFNANKIPAPARDRLKANPAEAAQFDEIFGKGAAAAVLGR